MIMEFAFLDESGDRGGMGSKYLVSTLIVTRKKKELVEIIVSMKKRLLESKKGRKWLNRNGGEIKFHNFPDPILLENSIKRFSELDMEIFSVVIHKNGSDIDPSIKETIFDLYYDNSSKRNKKLNIIKITADLNYFSKRKKDILLKLVERKTILDIIQNISKRR